ncbi:MAG: methyltransferase domain-containing protein [Caldilineaceae bacterium]|nr:methyltransferase domain-containing protein [Caldilineaceae bacterium]
MRQQNRNTTSNAQDSTSDWDQLAVDCLLSSKGSEALGLLRSADLSEANTLPLLTELRKQFLPNEAGALVTLARLRRRAAAKFPQAERLFFTPIALEQATAWPVALHRAERLSENIGDGPILDLGCGIGGDTLALAQFRPVIAYERDPVRLRLAQANAAALDLAGRIEFRLADWTEELLAGRLPAASAAYADPARRSGERRLFSLYEIEPPLPLLLSLAEKIPVVAVKVMPGVSDQELPAGLLGRVCQPRGRVQRSCTLVWSERPGRETGQRLCRQSLASAPVRRRAPSDTCFGGRHGLVRARPRSDSGRRVCRTVRTIGRTSLRPADRIPGCKPLAADPLRPGILDRGGSRL